MTNHDPRHVVTVHSELGYPDDALIERRKRIPLPHDPKTFLLAGIFCLAMLYTLRVASEIILPIVLAGVLNLLLQPGIRILLKWHIPKVIAAVIMISVLGCATVALGFTLINPVTEWIAKAPSALPRVEQKLSFFMKPLAKFQQTSEEVEKLGTSGNNTRIVSVKGPGLSGFLLTGTRTILTGILTVIVLLFFLLVAGDMFLRRLVEILPRLSDKKRAVEISNEIEYQISGYLLTISVMNLLVGIATGTAAYFCGLSDPLLWGTVAFLLNYILILGPMACATILFVAGLLNFDSTLQAMVLVGIYLAIHFLEGESITPMLVARRMTLNPVLVIISLVFWYWMWGVMGALLAVPMLGAFKIVCDRITPLMALGHFLGSEARST